MFKHLLKERVFVNFLSTVWKSDQKFRNLCDAVLLLSGMFSLYTYELVEGGGEGKRLWSRSRYEQAKTGWTLSDWFRKTWKIKSGW